MLIEVLSNILHFTNIFFKNRNSSKVKAYAWGNVSVGAKHCMQSG